MAGGPADISELMSSFEEGLESFEQEYQKHVIDENTNIDGHTIPNSDVKPNQIPEKRLFDDDSASKQADTEGTAAILADFHARLARLKLERCARKPIGIDPPRTSHKRPLHQRNVQKHPNLVESRQGPPLVANVRARMTKAKAVQVRQRIISQFKRQGVGTRTFAKFKHELCHRAGLRLDFASFQLDAEDLPDVLSRAQCKLAIATMTGFGSDDLTLALTLLDPMGSGEVSFDTMIDFLTDDMYIDSWFYEHNSGKGNVFSKQMRVFTTRDLRAEKALAAVTAASKRRSSIVNVNGNGFGSRSQPGHLAGKVPPWKRSRRTANIAVPSPAPAISANYRPATQAKRSRPHPAPAKHNHAVEEPNEERDIITDERTEPAGALTLESLASGSADFDQGAFDDIDAPKASRHHSPSETNQTEASPSSNGNAAAPIQAALPTTSRDNGESDLKAVQKLTSLQEQQLKFYESMMQTLLSP